MSLQSAPAARSSITLSSVWQDAGPDVRRNLLVLFGCQALTNGAVLSSTVLGSVIITHITGSEGLAGVPSATNFVSAALGAFFMGRLMAARGRRTGLALGYAIGVFGAVFGALMALEKNVFGFLAGGAMLGVCLGTVQQGRYAAADLVPASVRGRVIGGIVSGSVFGSVVAALLTPFVQTYAKSRGLPAEELVWFVAAGLLLAGLVLVSVFLHPSPSGLAVGEASSHVAPQEAVPARGFFELLRLPEVRLAAVCLGVGQGVMVMLMVLTPLHAKHLGHGLPTISGLLTGHTFGMFAFAWLTGQLVDLLGRRSVAMLGGLMLMLSAFIATFALGVPELAVSLFVLGLGWNFVNVAGSTLLTDTLRGPERARTQGTFEMISWISGSIGALGGGVIVAGSGFAAVGWVGLVISVAPLVGAMVTRPRVAQAI